MLFKNQLLQHTEVDEMLELVFGFATMRSLPFGATSALGSCLHGLRQTGYKFQKDYFQEAMKSYSQMVTERERDDLARREGVFGLASLLGIEISCPLSMTASTSSFCGEQSFRDDINAKSEVKKMHACHRYVIKRKQRS